MKRCQGLLIVLLVGSLWGLGEAIWGGLLYANDVPRASVYVSAWGLFTLCAGRALLDRPGSSTAAGAVAALFRLVNAGLFPCHLLGIFALGLGFDVAASLARRMVRMERTPALRAALAGAAGAYLGYGLFALAATYVLRHQHWAPHGLPKVLDHTFVNGSFAALAALVAAPLGWWAGAGAARLAEQRAKWVPASALTAAAALWLLGRLIG
ncbi:MAG: hypothetical protein HY812_08355 [Planctomycetes bacterium]|nr:hypothetical protein [Planctomycetota bacterium]